MNTNTVENKNGNRADLQPLRSVHGFAWIRNAQRSAHRPPGRLLAFSMGLALLTCAFVWTGCASNDDAYQIPAEAFTARPSGSLAVGDVIRVSYPATPELNLTQKIGVNGKVSLPTVGSVTAAGRSVGSFQSQLTSMYEPHLQNPQVLVSLEQPAAAVYVSGEVNNPGKVPLDRSMTALEAIMESGGFSKFANPKQVFVIRNEKGRQRRYALNLGDTLAGVENQAFYLRPFDMIYVKQSNW